MTNLKNADSWSVDFLIKTLLDYKKEGVEYVNGISSDDFDNYEGQIYFSRSTLDPKLLELDVYINNEV